MSLDEIKQMNAYEVIQIIKEIGDTNVRAEKEKLVRILAADEFGAAVLKWTYNPFITFGIRPALPQATGKHSLRLPIAESLLRRLAKRELTGNAAEREIFEVMEFLDKESTNLLFLILSKDLKCGIAPTTINLAVPGLIPTFSVMRAQKYEAKKVKSWPAKGEYKLDGQRNTFLCHDGYGAFFTRSGKVVPALDFIVPHVMAVAEYVFKVAPQLHRILKRPGEEAFNFMLDGEAMMGMFAETGALRRKGVNATGAELHLYDIMSYDDFDAVGSVGDQLTVRRTDLAQFVSLAKDYMAANAPDDAKEMIQIVPQFFINSDEEAQAFFEAATNKTLASYLARGDKAREAALLLTTIDVQTGKPKTLEGAMIKAPAWLYDKSKTNGWLKMKCEETEDLRIIGVFPGDKHTKYENCLGGLVVDRAGVRARVGGGFSDQERLDIWESWLVDRADIEDEDIVMDKDAFIFTGELGDPGSTDLIGRLIEVKFHEVTPAGSLRHSRFIRFRDDKDGELESKAA